MLSDKNRELWRVNKFVWLCLVFTGLWLAARWTEFAPAPRRAVALVFVCALVNVGLRTWVAWRSQTGTSGRLGWPFTVIDIVLIALGVRFTGGLASDLWLIFFLLVVTENLSVTVKQERLLLLLAFFGYTAAVWPIADWVTWTTHLFFLYVVSVIARRLYLNAEERRAQLARLQTDLRLAEENQRVSRELHDGIGRELVNVILGLEMAKRTAQKQPEEIGPLLDESLTLLRGAMNDTRALVTQTRAGSGGLATDAALTERIRGYAASFAARTGIAVDVQAEPTGCPLPPPTAFALLRIVQEALNNVAKHAGASRVHIGLTCEENILTVTVADDGCGFAPVPNGDGIGLRVLSERAAEVGGKAQTESAPGAGTTVTASVPVNV